VESLPVLVVVRHVPFESLHHRHVLRGGFLPYRFSAEWIRGIKGKYLLLPCLIIATVEVSDKNSEERSNKMLEKKAMLKREEEAEEERQ
jgi:hypothetical protein